MERQLLFAKLKQKATNCSAWAQAGLGSCGSESVMLTCQEFLNAVSISPNVTVVHDRTTTGHAL